MSAKMAAWSRIRRMARWAAARVAKIKQRDRYDRHTTETKAVRVVVCGQQADGEGEVALGAL